MLQCSYGELRPIFVVIGGEPLVFKSAPCRAGNLRRRNGWLFGRQKMPDSHVRVGIYFLRSLGESENESTARRYALLDRAHPIVVVSHPPCPPMAASTRTSHTKTPDRREPIGRFGAPKCRSAHRADAGQLRHVVGGTGRRRSLSGLIVRRNGSFGIHGFVGIRSRSRWTVCRVLADCARERSHAHDERKGQNRRQEGLECGRVGHGTEDTVAVFTQCTTHKLVLVRIVVTRNWVSVSSVRIPIRNLIVLGVLLHRNVLLGIRRGDACEAIAAAAQQKGSSAEHGDQDGAKSGRVRAFHGTTKLLAWYLRLVSSLVYEGGTGGLKP